MPLFDVRAEIWVKTKAVKEFYEQKLFVPDTLWHHSLKLEPVGETRLMLPDSIYPKADFDYEIVAAFINAENERQIKTITTSYYARETAQIKCTSDSISFVYSVPGTYEVRGYNTNNQLIDQVQTTLPYRCKINPAVRYYELQYANSTLRKHSMDEVDELVSLLASRTSDSLLLTLQNPRKLWVRFQIFKNNQIIKSGYLAEFSFQLKAKANDRYYVSMQYIWAGSAKNQEYDLSFSKKTLQISIDHPASVFPGQSVDLSLQVKDAYGKAVGNADITAYARTRKFQQQVVTIPSFDRTQPRKAFNSFHEAKINRTNIKKQLEYTYWRAKLGLDSLQFYQFLYPANGIFQQEISSEDSITQIAPFVVRHGKVQPVYYIYFNKVLKYYYEVETITPYSFAVEGDIKNLSIRLRDRLISLPDIKVTKGKKLILSVDLDRLPSSVSVIERPAKLEVHEKQNLQPHFMWVNRTNEQRNAYLAQGNNYYLFKPYTLKGNEMTGPFYPGPVEFNGPYQLVFPFRSGRVYTFRHGIVDRDAYASKHTLLITDACFSGSIFKTRAVDAMTIKRVHELYKDRSRKAITSGNLTEVADKSFFIQYLLKLLKENDQEFLPASILFSRLYEPVTNNTASIPQFGVIQGAGDEGGDFIFIKKEK
jgi:hypothetical protein